jgi:hypothetical protein
MVLASVELQQCLIGPTAVCMHAQGSIFQDPEIINAFSGAIAGMS